MQQGAHRRDIQRQRYQSIDAIARASVGSIINVLHQRKRGVVIASGATRIALGPDMADKLQVQSIN